MVLKYLIITKNKTIIQISNETPFSIRRQPSFLKLIIMVNEVIEKTIYFLTVTLLVRLTFEIAEQNLPNSHSEQMLL